MESNRPNTTSAAPMENTMTLEQTIATQLTAMRNPSATTNDTSKSGALTNEEAEVEVPEGEEVFNKDASELPEIAEPEVPETADATDESETPLEVSEEDAEATTDAEVIDFIEFANENPNAKFKFKRNGEDVIIDAKKAAAILGQGGAIHEDARQLKIEKADFEEWKKEENTKQANLTLAMEMALVPQIQDSVNEINKISEYNTIFSEQWYAATSDAEKQKIEASIEKNNKVIQRLQQEVESTSLPLNKFYEQRKAVVSKELESRRKNFSDKELRNEYLFNELRDKISKEWAWASQELIHGVPNIDLISSDEHILALIRDGMKYREKPKAKSAGNSFAALTTKKSSGATKVKSQQEEFNSLQTLAKQGNKEAQKNLLTAQLNALRSR